MAKKQIFGTDGIRTTANVYPLTPEAAVKVGKAVTRWFQKKNPAKKIEAAIGTDTRISSEMLSAAVSAGIMAAGGNVTDLKVVSTPLVSDFVRTNRCDFGIVISASHNPFEDNGIKIFNSKGEKLNDEQELEIEALFFDGNEAANPTGKDVGTARIAENPEFDYVSRIVRAFGALKDSDVRLCIDCANGATAKIAKKIFGYFGKMEKFFFFTEANGININDNCGALHPENIAPKILENKCIAGFAYDGDGDRLITIDDLGRVVDGDKIIGIIAKYLNKNGALSNNSVAVTVMSNSGLEKHLKNFGIALERTNVGDRYLVERINEKGLSLAGENSGHLIIRDINPTGDGIVASLMILKILAESGRKLSELADEIELFPQIQAKVKIKEKTPIEEIPGLPELIRSQEALLDGGRMLVRYSGTEPVMRVMAEGPDSVKVQNAVDKVADFVKELNSK